MTTRRQSLSDTISNGAEMIIVPIIHVWVWGIGIFCDWCFMWFKFWGWILMLAARNVIWFFFVFLISILVVLYSLGMIGALI